MFHFKRAGGYRDEITKGPLQHPTDVGLCVLPEQVIQKHLQNKGKVQLCKTMYHFYANFYPIFARLITACNITVTCVGHVLHITILVTYYSLNYNLVWLLWSLCRNHDLLKHVSENSSDNIINLSLTYN